MNKSECQDYYLLADESKLCKHAEKTVHCICENIVKNGECPRGCVE